jgi:CRISPR-associated endonuclease Csn1
MGLDKFEIINKDIIDYETGEIFDQQKFKQLNDETIYNSYLFYKKIMDMKIEIVKAERIVRYSYKVDKKVNRKLSNETIYGVREKENKEKYKISKVKNIYDRNGFEVFKKKLKEDKDGKSKLDDFLMYHHDKKTFESLLKVIKLYPDKANPFAAYREEYGEPIRKYSKKGNGPFVKSLKYYDGKIGSHIDISHKYGHKIGSKKVILDSLNPYRTDVYFRESDQSYHLAGIKYANFKFIKGKYKLDEEMYNKILIDEGILCEGQSYKNIDKYGFVFLFSLYKNDLILYEKNGEEKLERFLSRTMPNNKNYIETKPVESKKFEKPRNLVGLSKTKRIVKVNTDVLGNRYYSEKEKFNLEFTLDK